MRFALCSSAIVGCRGRFGADFLEGNAEERVRRRRLFCADDERRGKPLLFLFLKYEFNAIIAGGFGAELDGDDFAPFLVCRFDACGT